MADNSSDTAPGGAPPPPIDRLLANSSRSGKNSPKMKLADWRKAVTCGVICVTLTQQPSINLASNQFLPFTTKTKRTIVTKKPPRTCVSCDVSKERVDVTRTRPTIIATYLNAAKVISVQPRTFGIR
jgi:hypothetical protein